MLDNYGFVAETNATNLFMAKNSILYTPFADACLPGITRQHVINIANDLNISFKEKNLSVSEFYNADEVFTTGTMGELTPVIEIDGRKIENKSNSQILKTIQYKFREKTNSEGEEILK